MEIECTRPRPDLLWRAQTNGWGLNAGAKELKLMFLIRERRREPDLWRLQLVVETSPVDASFFQDDFSGPCRAEGVGFLLMKELCLSFLFFFFLHLICPRKASSRLAVHHLPHSIDSRLRFKFKYANGTVWKTDNLYEPDIGSST